MQKQPLHPLDVHPQGRATCMAAANHTARACSLLLQPDQPYMSSRQSQHKVSGSAWRPALEFFTTDSYICSSVCFGTVLLRSGCPPGLGGVGLMLFWRVSGANCTCFRLGTALLLNRKVTAAFQPFCQGLAEKRVCSCLRSCSNSGSSSNK